MESNIKFIPLGTIKNSWFFLSFQLLRDVTITCKHFDVYNTAFMLYSLYSCSYSTPSKIFNKSFWAFFCFFYVLHLSSHFGLFGRFPTRRFKLGLAFLILGRKNFCPKVQTCRNAQNAAFGKITRDNFHLEQSLGMTLHFFYFMVNSMISKAGRSSFHRLS